MNKQCFAVYFNYYWLSKNVCVLLELTRTRGCPAQIGRQFLDAQAHFSAKGASILQRAICTLFGREMRCRTTLRVMLSQIRMCLLIVSQLQ